MTIVNFVFVLIFSCFSLVNCIPAYLSHLFKEEVNYELESVENCDPDSLWKWYENVKLTDGTKLVINANGTADRDLDDSESGIVQLYKYSDNDWKPFFKIMKDKICTTSKTIFEDDFVLFTKILGLESSDCPIPKNTYVIKDYLVDLRDTIFNKFLIGKYKATVELFGQNKEKLLCAQVIATSSKRNN